MNGKYAKIRLSIILVASASMILISMLPIQAAAMSNSQSGYAVLIGISDYGPLCGYGDLTYCHKDALDMRDMLVEDYGWKSSQIRVLLNESATEANIIEGIEWLEENCMKPKSTAIFYFSGHGDFWPDHMAVPNDDEVLDRAIIPYDGNTGTMEHEMFDDDLQLYFSDFDKGKLVLILDSCYSGGMIDEMGEEGTLILASASPHEMCWEGGDHGKAQMDNGVFTYCLLEALDGAGDSNEDGVVSLEEAGAYAAIHVRDYTRQVHPMVYDGIDGETLL